MRVALGLGGSDPSLDATTVLVKWRPRLRLTPPAQLTWVIALILGILGILMRTGALRLPGLGIESFWLVTAAFVLLAVAPLAKGL